MSESLFHTVPDGTQIHIKKFKAPSQSRAGSILHIHGFAEHCGRYDHHWQLVSQAGFDLLTFDLRGHGRSTGKRNIIADWNQLVSDVQHIVEIEKSFLGEKYFVFGHSTGGAIATTCLFKNVIAPKAVILSAPAIRAGRAIPLWGKIASPILGKLAPWLVLPPTYGEEVLTTVKAEQEKAHHDPLMFSKTSPTNYVRIFGAGRWNLEQVHLWNCPLFLMFGEQDELIDPSAMKEFYAKVQVDEKEMWSDPESRHELLFDVHAGQARQKIIEWFKQFA